MSVRKDEKGYYKLDNRGYRRKLVKIGCVMCDCVRFVRPCRITKHCRACAYIVNAFKINNYIKRPPRGEDGRYKSVKNNSKAK